MANHTPNLVEQIDDALRCITDAFVRQCCHGAQTKSLKPEFAACGQFIGGDAEKIQQHGLHGISAALRVLGPCQLDECKPIVHRIVAYCEASFGVHPTHQKSSHLDERHDTENVIKLGELLYGLSFVTTAQAEQDRLIQHVAKLLNDSLTDGKGWGYFLRDKEPELLPTAYAIRGLAQNGYDTNAPRKFILESLTARDSSGSFSPADLTTVVACMYCLTFCPRKGEGQDSVLKTKFLSVWSFLEPLLVEDIEQNIEYYRADDTKYVRIPWQLYLLALASEYSQWRFAAFRVQRRLRAVIRALRTDSFKYPHSGHLRSSRTNSVAYDVLVAIRERTRRLIWLRLASAIDAVRVFVGSRFVRRIAALFALVLLVLSIRQWWHAGKISDIAPELLASLLMLMLASAKK